MFLFNLILQTFQDSNFEYNLKEDGQLRPAYFAPSQFGENAISKDENVFFLEKKHSFFIFSNGQNFLIFFVKKLQIQGGKDIFK